MNILENISKTIVPEMNWDIEKNISYTQLSAWSECPHKWKLMYIDKMKQPPSIHLSFGTAMHETIQTYMDLMYNKGQQHADEFDAQSDFQKRFMDLYKADVEKLGNNFATKEQIDNYIAEDKKNGKFTNYSSSIDKFLSKNAKLSPGKGFPSAPLNVFTNLSISIISYFIFL